MGQGREENELKEKRTIYTKGTKGAYITFECSISSSGWWEHEVVFIIV